MHIGDEVVVLRHHLEGEVRSEAVAAQAPPQPVHHSCADCQLVGACALTCSHMQAISPATEHACCLVLQIVLVSQARDKQQNTAADMHQAVYTGNVTGMPAASVAAAARQKGTVGSHGLAGL